MVFDWSSKESLNGYRFLNFFLCLGAPLKRRATKTWSIDSFNCSPPRKSLVKGERFIKNHVWIISLHGGPSFV